MRIHHLLLSAFILITISCSSDDTSTESENEKIEKKLSQIIIEYSNLNTRTIRNMFYDASGNILRTTDIDGLEKSTFSYNETSQLITKSFSEYEGVILYFKEVDSIFYTSESKISKIKTFYRFYNEDGSVRREGTENHSYSHSANKIVKQSDDVNNTKIEYGLENDLITSIKIYEQEVLKSDMSFQYDSERNCISGKGPIDEGSFESITDNIDLTVTYGNEEKNPFFNKFFDYEILTSTSFRDIRQVLINKQGSKFPLEIKWYQYEDYIYKETFENSFDDFGYLKSRKLSEFPGFLNYGEETYTWK